MTKAEFNALIRQPNLAPRNPVGGTVQGAQPERAVRHEPVAEAQGKGQHTSRYAVRVVSRRQRLLDPDNLIPKYFIDSLRYAGLLPDDCPEIIELAVTQEKVGTKAECCTLIEIEVI